MNKDEHEQVPLNPRAMSFPVIITVNVNQEILDEYIEHVKSFNYYYAKRHESLTYRNKALDHHEKMQQIQSNLGWNVLVGLERFTGKSIPVEL